MLKIPSNIVNKIIISLEKYPLNNIQLAHLLANCEIECNWTNFQENFNYSPERLLKIFPSKIKNIKQAKSLIKEGTIVLSSFIYENILGNRSNTIDGYLYSGKGCLQLTGLNNYIEYNKTTLDDIVKHPWMLKDKYNVDSAFWFFDKYVKNQANDLTENTISIVRKKISGSLLEINKVTPIVIDYYSHLSDNKIQDFVLF